MQCIEIWSLPFSVNLEIQRKRRIVLYASNNESIVWKTNKPIFKHSRHLSRTYDSIVYPGRVASVAR